MSGPDTRAETTRWLAFAADDLKTAEALAGLEDISPRHICYLGQQAAEKALKAVLIFEGLDVPRTHDLEVLRALFPVSWGSITPGATLAVLSEWATQPRYPGDLPEATEDDADDALELARSLVEHLVAEFAARGVVI